nr:MAG TPA: hypothetical protein [Caudoviricetes sp.]
MKLWMEIPEILVDNTEGLNKFQISLYLQKYP